MPHFTLPITPAGPVMALYIGVSQAKRGVLTAAGLSIPPPILIKGLVDTGASGTCVDPAHIQQLGLTPTGTVPVLTPSTGATPHSANQYDVSIFIPGATQNHPVFSLQNVAVLESHLTAGQGIDALIGRDILAHCLLNYDGASGLFTIAY